LYKCYKNAALYKLTFSDESMMHWFRWQEGN